MSTEDKLYITEEIKALTVGMPSSTLFRVRKELYDALKDEVNFQAAEAKRPRYYVTDPKDQDVVRGWLVGRLTEMAKTKRATFAMAGSEQGTLNLIREPIKKHSPKEDPQINVRANKAGLIRLIETMRKSGYIIECRITEPMENL